MKLVRGESDEDIKKDIDLLLSSVKNTKTMNDPAFVNTPRTSKKVPVSGNEYAIQVAIEKGREKRNR